MAMTMMTSVEAERPMRMALAAQGRSRRIARMLVVMWWMWLVWVGVVGGYGKTKSDTPGRATAALLPSPPLIFIK